VPNQCRSDWPDRPNCASILHQRSFPTTEQSGEGKLIHFFVADLNQFFSIPRNVFEPGVCSLPKPGKILWIMLLMLERHAISPC
jgi:hypothetical protein